MSESVILVGVLADARMQSVLGLSGTPATVPGTLVGGAMAGIDRDGWPRLVPGQGTVPAVRVTPNPALERYAAVMGLTPVDHPLGPVLGVGVGAHDGEAQPALAAAIADHVLGSSRSAADVAARLPMIGVRAASELRGASEPLSGADLVAAPADGDVAVIDRDEAFAGFSAVEVYHLRHRTHAGGMTPVIRREGFVCGDAVVVLPWDPARDRVLLIEQFRLAPLLRRDPQPWLLETFAGRIDAGETVQQAARREAQEEANLVIDRLFPAIHHYPSPGMLGEYLYLFVGIADLPDGVEGVHGLDSEDEDIRSHLVSRADLTRMAMDGQLTNGPLAMIALWLELRHDALRADLEIG